MPSGGVSKKPDSKSESIEKLQKVVEKANEGAVSRQKLDSVEQQAIVSDASAAKSSGENKQDQPQHHAPTGGKTPHCDTAIPSVEPNDIEMKDLSTHRQTEVQHQSTRDDSPEVQSDLNRPNARALREQRTGSLARGFKRLAILDPPTNKSNRRLEKNQDFDSNEIVDGWGTLRGSNFVIVQEGPPEAARFVFKFRRNYTDKRTANISDKDFRISAIQDRGFDGKKTFRYTRENVAGVFGAAIEDTGARVSTRSPCSWVRVEWKNLTKEDIERCKVSGGCSWIPKSDFIRFCYGREAAEAKIKQVWDSQEEQYVSWAQGEPGAQNRTRSTTPCPLNDSLERLRQRKATSRRATSRLRTPDIRISSPAVDGLPPPRQNDAGTRSNPVRLDEETEHANSPPTSGLTSAVAESNESNKRDTPEPQRHVVEFSKAEFMREQASKDDWNPQNPSEEKMLQVQAEALYKIFRATMLQNGGREVNGSSAPVSVEEEL